MTLLFALQIKDLGNSPSNYTHCDPTSWLSWLAVKLQRGFLRLFHLNVRFHQPVWLKHNQFIIPLLPSMPSWHGEGQPYPYLNILNFYISEQWHHQYTCSPYCYGFPSTEPYTGQKGIENYSGLMYYKIKGTFVGLSI
jgi:hypothetical protein